MIFFFKKCNNINIYYFKEIDKLLNEGKYDEYHICSTRTAIWQHHNDNFILRDHPNINKSHYFCYENPLYNYHKINDNYISNPNIKLPIINTEINSIVYYKFIGLNNNVRMNYFNYSRDYEKEIEIKKNILNQYGLKEGEKYNIINTIVDSSNGDYINIDRITNLINNNYICINISMLVKFSGWLFLLIEGAEELHLVEGLNTNFIYYSQYKIY